MSLGEGYDEGLCGGVNNEFKEVNWVSKAEVLDNWKKYGVITQKSYNINIEQTQTSYRVSQNTVPTLYFANSQLPISSYDKSFIQFSTALPMQIFKLSLIIFLVGL